MAAATPDPEAAGTVPDDQAADTREPRHGQVSIRMLEEPPVALPRTKAQQEADVHAAAELVRTLADSGETTDELDNYFPRVKERFKLSQIGYVLDGSGVSILLKVNSEERVPVREELQRLDHPLIQGDPARATKIEYHTDDRIYSSLSDPVYTRSQSGLGVRMVADPLTPLHGQGSGPRGTALADVFELLETQGETGSHGYIKGHLLNDNLGGPGEDRNLFPITQTANSRHHSEIENTAKELVNDHHFWVRYNVAMHETDQMRYIDRAGHPRLAINSVIEARLDVLKSDLRSSREVVRVSIPSRFNPERGHVDYRDMTRRQLQEVVDQQGVDAAAAQAEIDRREDLTHRFDAAPENQMDGATDNDLLKELRSETATEFQQDTDVTQDQVLLSTARSGADRSLILEPDTITALRGLAGLNAADSPFEGAATLDKRLADAAIGTSNHTLLLQTAEAALQARGPSGDNDLAEVTTLSEPQKDVLRQINSAGPIEAIRAVIGQYRKENNSLARLEGLPGLPSEADLDYFNRQFSQARQTERVAFAGLVAARYRTRSAGRSALQAMGKWGSSASFYTSLRTKILALPAGDID
ncbi:hypothetical protein LH51_10775 [Nitrincola sp. A-D6]|uniref:DNA/RNA non-specific endonuclease n=1 Tax=Nitrincola sp. A-D6 TaxID=1545442 RepID=UPI00051FCF9C|nr:DNA/RNA non-specific endonuclease [Nitrincola sp. A-D6]KGK41940.1 hypothetical protein LH51_10775 [Nitrincola sp. A-D6]